MQCRMCGNADPAEMFTRPAFPVYVWPINPAADQAYERLRVTWCPDCGLVQLDRFSDEFVRSLYSEEVFGLVSTGEFRSTSVKNNAFLKYCAGVLGHDWVQGKKLLDVGGYDLLTCVDLDFAEAVICDPNAPALKPKDNVTIYREFFSKDSFDREEFDVVIAKHVVEHIDDVVPFIEGVRHALKKHGRLIVEVPELTAGIRDRGSYASFYHQHLIYFDRHTLGNLLRKSGFRILTTDESQGNLRMIAEKADRPEGALRYDVDRDMPARIKEYASGLDRYFVELERFLTEPNQEKIICYGAGGKTTILLHLCRAVRESIELIVDSSGNKIGKKIGGTDFMVRPPEILGSFSHKNILVNSDMFFDEIVGGIQEQYEDRDFQILRISPEFEKITLSKAGYQK